MSMLLPLSPGQSIKVTAASSSAAKALPGVGRTIEIVNASANAAAVALGGSSITAAAPGSSFAAACYHIPGVVGARRVITRDPDNQTYIAYIRDAESDATLYICCGDGE